MANRSNLQTLLETIVDNVYFQPPESVNMNYPCIVYSRNDIDTTFADDKPYSHRCQYILMIIDEDPDSVIIDAVANLPLCKFDRHYVKDNMYHDVFTLYY